MLKTITENPQAGCLAFACFGSLFAAWLCRHFEIRYLIERHRRKFRDAQYWALVADYAVARFALVQKDLQIAELIRQQQLTTHTTTTCAPQMPEPDARHFNEAQLAANAEKAWCN